MIAVRDRVIITDDSENEHTGTVVNISDYREPSMRYAVDLDDYKDDFVFVSDERIRKERPCSDTA